MSKCKFRSKDGERCIKPVSHKGNEHRDKQNNRWHDDGVVLDEVADGEKPLNGM